ncbi:MAG: carbohydrate ABC transporter permease [Alphaproteobacteria bacterium]|nr:carbohydrate ABC transporter permease [Alphaproteobacteria bacterium]
MIYYLKKNWSLYAWYAIIFIGLIITILPFWWGLAASFKDNTTIFNDLKPFSFNSLIPGTSLNSYIDIFENNFGRAIFNTLVVSIASVAGGIIINSMAGFAFAQFRFKGDNILFLFILLSFAVPADAIAIPLFKMIRQIGWFDTYYALIIPMLSNGLIIFLFRQFFLGIPKELIEASRVDGLSWFGVYWKICMPLARPITLGASLLLFVFQWESFLWPLIAAPSQELNLIQVALARFSTEFAANWSQQFAASTIAGLLPLIFIYMFQKQFVSALTGVEQK